MPRIRLLLPRQTAAVRAHLLQSPTLPIAMCAAGSHVVSSFNITSAAMLQYNWVGACNTAGYVQGSSGGRVHSPTGVAVQSASKIFISDSGNHAVRYSGSTGYVYYIVGDGSASAGAVDAVGSGAKFNFPGGLAINSNGDVYVADVSNNAIRLLTYPPRMCRSMDGMPALFCHARWCDAFRHLLNSFGCQPPLHPLLSRCRLSNIPLTHP